MSKLRRLVPAAAYWGIIAAVVPAFASPAHGRRAAASAAESVAAEVVRELQERLPAWLKGQAVPGLAIAVVDDRSVLWQVASGTTVRGQGAPVTPRTLFSIQSMSKSFAALAVLMAVQDGLLDLDRPITDYWPDFTVHSRFEERPEKRITLRHLLAHRAGFTHEAPLGGNFDSRPHTFAEHVISVSDTWLRYPVGYRYSYSNLGIDLAGWILEKTSGVPFVKYVRDKVLTPLGMADTTLDIEAILKADDRAVGHVAPSLKVAGGIPVEVPMIPAGGVYTNVVDMARYLMFHINKGRVGGAQVLRRDLIEAMHTVQFPEKGERFGYGLGIAVNHLGPEVYLSHGGGGYGFTSSMAMYPGLKLGVIVLTNSGQNGVVGPAGNIVNAVLEARLGPPDPEAEKPTADIKHPVAATDKRVKRLLGFYGGGLTIGTKDGTLGANLSGRFYPLTFYADGGELVGLFGKYSELRAKPSFRDGEPGTLVVLNRLAGTCAWYDFHKPWPEADPQGPDKPEWQPYLGTYRTLMWGRAFGFLANVAVVNGYLTFNGARCREYMPGLFFTYEGEAVNFRGAEATFRNITLIRTRR